MILDPRPREDDLGRSHESCPDDYTIEDRTREELANGDGLDPDNENYDADYGEFENDDTYSIEDGA
jgi:hypothetical protein